MNLFCFSSEGSMDSSYEAVQSSTDGPPPPIPSRSSSRSCSRSCSPADSSDDNTRWRGSGRSISMDMPQTHGVNSDKKNRRTHISKSSSDNETSDNPGCNTAAWQQARSQEDLIHITNNQNEDMRKQKHRSDKKGGKGGHHTKKKDKQQTNQSVHSNGVMTEPKAAVRKNLKNGKKSGGRTGKEGPKKRNNRVCSPPKTMSPLLGPHYSDVPYTSRSDRRMYLGKSSTLPAPENTTPGRCSDMVSLPGGATPTHHQRWSNPEDSCPVWGTIEHTCCRPLAEYRMLPHEFTMQHGKEWDETQQPAVDQNGSLKRSCQPHPKVPRSITEVDLSEPNRSTSFGRFEGLRHHSSHGKTEENETNTLREECDSPDPGRSAGFGKKMKEISSTMRRKMGKKHAKSLSEETGDDTDKDPEAETESSPPVEKTSTKTSNSLESLYSGQSSSSGVTSESNSSGQRDSSKSEEDGSYQGQFCGRARVHTDFVPSPYDTDSSKSKVGDIIHIISKPPMGIWTGMLHNKVGNFKFIYVDVLPEEKEKEAEEETPKIRQQKSCKRPRPKTSSELSERSNSEEYASASSSNGYQTVEDSSHSQEKHSIESNVKDPEHRRRSSAAAECRYAEGDDTSSAGEHKSSHGQQEEDSDCPRDSGCFIPSECSDTKEDPEQVADAGEA